MGLAKLDGVDERYPSVRGVWSFDEQGGNGSYKCLLLLSQALRVNTEAD